MDLRMNGSKIGGAWIYLGLNCTDTRERLSVMHSCLLFTIEPFADVLPCRRLPSEMRLSVRRSSLQRRRRRACSSGR